MLRVHILNRVPRQGKGAFRVSRCYRGTGSFRRTPSFSLKGCLMVSRQGSCRATLDYVLDRSDRVGRVCSCWSQAAHERMGFALDDEVVLGRRVWDFVHGGATQRLYDALLHHVRRTGHKASFAYRGDSPGAIRYMRMVLLPGPNGSVRFRSELMHEQLRQRAVYFTHAAYPRHPELLQCGFCQKIEYQGRWYTVGEALALTDAIDELWPTEVGDTVCDHCITKVELTTGVRL